MKTKELEDNFFMLLLLEDILAKKKIKRTFPLWKDGPITRLKFYKTLLRPKIFPRLVQFFSEDTSKLSVIDLRESLLFIARLHPEWFGKRDEDVFWPGVDMTIEFKLSRPLPWDSN